MKIQDIISKEYIKLDINDFLSKFIGQIIKHPEDDDALIFDKKKFKGVLKRQWILQSRVDASKTKVKNFIAHVSSLDPEDDLKKAAKLMYASDFRLLPVEQNGEIIGVIKAKDIFKSFRVKGKAEQIASTKLVVLNEKARYGNAINVMKETKLGHVPIVDDKGELSGIVTRTDWMKKYLMLPKNSDFGAKEFGHMTRAHKEKNNMLDLPIKDIMRGYGVVTASPNASIRKIIDLIIEGNAPSVVLIKDNKPVGIITIRDLLRFFVEQG